MAGAPSDQRRELLLHLYRAALSAVDGRRRVRAALAADQDERPVSILAVGKAAPAMTQGALDALGARVVRALVIAPDDGLADDLLALPHITCLAGDHPVPGERSLAAGSAALAFAGATPPGSRVLLLVSGGASALLEVMAPGVTLAKLQRLNEWAHSEAVDIVALNAGRASLSLVKAGRLPGLFRNSEVEGLMISDVPGDDPAVVGSGLLASPACRVTLVGCLDDALDAALCAARTRGLDARRSPVRLSGDAVSAARAACHEFAVGNSNLQLWGGETVVRLPARPGRGGRCQHFALAAARQIAGHPELVVLAAGTDGRDGASEDAGAIVDGGTLARARDAGYDAAKCLEAADSGSLLEAAGDLIYTGPTGTNVGDLVLALRLR
jgi:hydroxypyruvate reductase